MKRGKFSFLDTLGEIACGPSSGGRPLSPNFSRDTRFYTTEIRLVFFKTPVDRTAPADEISLSRPPSVPIDSGFQVMVFATRTVAFRIRGMDVPQSDVKRRRFVPDDPVPDIGAKTHFQLTISSQVARIRRLNCLSKRPWQPYYNDTLQRFRRTIST